MYCIDLSNVMDVYKVRCGNKLCELQILNSTTTTIREYCPECGCDNTYIIYRKLFINIIYSPERGLCYRNAHCSVCNIESMENIIQWKLKFNVQTVQISIFYLFIPN